MRRPSRSGPFLIRRYRPMNGPFYYRCSHSGQNNCRRTRSVSLNHRFVLLLASPFHSQNSETGTRHQRWVRQRAFPKRAGEIAEVNDRRAPSPQYMTSRTCYQLLGRSNQVNQGVLLKARRAFFNLDISSGTSAAATALLNK
jgi:hypothetical protein